MGRKKWWLLSGIIYVALVIGVYSLVTGSNPLESGHMQHDMEHSEETHEHDHHSHSGESQVEVHIHQDNEKLIIHLKDKEGNAPELVVTHEKLMHLILVSSDLEDFHHFHPAKAESGAFEQEIDLPDGQYFAFVDMKPEGKSYTVEPIEVMIGEHPDDRGMINLQLDRDLVINKRGKEVELVTPDLKAGEGITLIFDLKDETPEPYLGALGHVVIIDASVENYIHVHPKSEDTTVFEAYFPHEGMYKLWAEFKFSDEGVIAFPFVLEVK